MQQTASQMRSVQHDRRFTYSNSVSELLRLAMFYNPETVESLLEEQALAAAFGVSRNAIREGLAVLQADMVIDRRRGSGTHALLGQMHAAMGGIHGLSSTTSTGDTIGQKVLPPRFDLPTECSDALLPEFGGQQISVILQVTTVNDAPTSLSTRFVPRVVADHIPVGAIPDWYVVLEGAAGVPIDRGNLQITAGNVTDGLADRLRARPGATVLRLMRTLYAADGQVLEHSTTACLTSALVLNFTLTR